MRASFSFPRERQEPGAKQAAEKLRMNDERAKFEGCETINQPSRIVPRASRCDPFFALSDKLSFSAACKAPFCCASFTGLKAGASTQNHCDWLQILAFDADLGSGFWLL